MSQETLSSNSAASPLLLMSVGDLAKWRTGRLNQSGRLYLPPIQRSIVWSHEQVINYWDSLLRGYPPGMMMIHRAGDAAGTAGVQGMDDQYHTVEVKAFDDEQLFDGQQRMAAILLGMRLPPLREGRRLWVDLGVRPKPGSNLKFQLRITTPGQPFGYRPDAPNQKLEWSSRQAKWEAWADARQKEKEDREKDGLRHRHEPGTSHNDRLAVFNDDTGDWLAGARCPVPFEALAERLLKGEGKASCMAWCLAEYGDRLDHELLREFVDALEKALESQVVLCRIPAEIVSSQDEYIRFFGRLGQGGTRLSEDELSYSIIKHQYPKIRDRMKSIMAAESAGRVLDEVELVLAALRAVRAIHVISPNAQDWERVGRPTPDFISQLQSGDFGDQPDSSGIYQGVRAGFEAMFALSSAGPVADFEIKRRIEGLRGALEYKADTHPGGLPAILLARLPRELVEVLLLLSVRRGDAAWSKAGGAVGGDPLLTAFVLHWLLFVGNEGKAGWEAYLKIRQSDWVWGEAAVRELISLFEEIDAAYVLPDEADIETERQVVMTPCDAQSDRAPHLRSRHERFVEIDKGGERKPGEALRQFSGNKERIKRALMWLQRGYIGTGFQDYDPTQGHDEDLPIDLDHLIPSAKFNFRWNERATRLDPSCHTDNIRYERGELGNTLGNFRWLDASENRRRQDGPLEYDETDSEAFGRRYCLDAPGEWNTLIDLPVWGKGQLAGFQRLIDLRTLTLYRELVDTSGVGRIALRK